MTALCSASCSMHLLRALDTSSALQQPPSSSGMPRIAAAEASSIYLSSTAPSAPLPLQQPAVTPPARVMHCLALLLYHCISLSHWLTTIRSLTISLCHDCVTLSLCHSNPLSHYLTGALCVVQVGGGGGRETRLADVDLFNQMVAWNDADYIMAAGTHTSTVFVTLSFCNILDRLSAHATCHMFHTLMLSGVIQAPTATTTHKLTT